MSNSNPLLFVLFGATGDLARLKILPALVNLQRENTLGRPIKLVATGRREMTPGQYCEYMTKVEPHPFTGDATSLNLQYIQLEFDGEQGFANLWELLKQYPGSEIIFYMSVGADVLDLCIARFQDSDSHDFLSSNQIKIVAEKPFGQDLAQAIRFNKALSGLFGEENVYRNDHYLFKNTVQALSEIKHTDPQIQDVLNNQWINEIKLVVSEEVDLGTRAGYFEGVGILRDWFQSHMMQILAQFCADPGESDRPDGSGEQNFISGLTVIPDSIIRAQYNGYIGSAGVDPHSLTETFLAVRLRSGLQRWQGTEFALVCGKGLAEKEISITLSLHKQHPQLGNQINLNLTNKTGHPLLEGKQDGDEFEKLISEVANGNNCCFPSQGEVESQWEITEMVAKCMNSTPMDNYEKGTSYLQFCSKHWC